MKNFGSEKTKNPIKVYAYRTEIAEGLGRTDTAQMDIERA